MSGELVRYDAMCRAIDAAYEVDEVKDIRDKARAVASLESANDLYPCLPPRLPGVYVFDGMAGALYVGESRDLRNRLRGHERGYLRRQVGVRLRMIVCRNHKQVERWLIDELKPSLNGVSEHMRGMQPRDSRSFDEIWDEFFGGCP